MKIGKTADALLKKIFFLNSNPFLIDTIGL